MKKILSILIAFIATTASFATSTLTYNGDLTAKGRGTIGSYVNGQQSDVKVYLTSNDDNTYNIELKNFSITMSGETYYIGNINVPNMTATFNEDGTTTLTSKAPSDGSNNIILSDGDDPADATWLGSSLGGASGDVEAKCDGNKISLQIPVTVAIALVSIVVDVTYNGTTDDISGISAPTVSMKKSTVTYNAAGQQVSANAKGLIITNGRKHLNK